MTLVSSFIHKLAPVLKINYTVLLVIETIILKINETSSNEPIVYLLSINIHV